MANGGGKKCFPSLNNILLVEKSCVVNIGEVYFPNAIKVTLVLEHSLSFTFTIIVILARVSSGFFIAIWVQGFAAFFCIAFYLLTL